MTKPPAVATINRGKDASVVLVRRGDGTTFQYLFERAGACCADEAALYALAEVFTTTFVGEGRVAVVITQLLIEGYLRRGWEPKSLSMLAALRAFACATDGYELELHFKKWAKATRSWVVIS